MTSQYKLNQGASNSYKPEALASGGRVEKIEYSYRLGVKISDMSESPRHMNMFSHEDDSYIESDCYSVYSDAGLDDFYNEDIETSGDRYDEEELVQTEQEKQADLIAEQEQEHVERMARFCIQNPDEMELIRPMRALPSVKEMYDEWYALLDVEARSRAYASAVPIISRVWRLFLDRKTELKVEKAEQLHRSIFREWNKRRSPCCIKQLTLLVNNTTFNEQYIRMLDINDRHRLIKTAVEERSRMISVVANRNIAAEKSKAKAQVAFKARAIAKAGMNKKSTWHQERLAGALAFKTTTVADQSETGKGKRVQRKIKQEKERKEAIAEAARLPPIEKKPIVIDIILETEEEKSAAIVEASELAKELVRINRFCVEKVEQLVAQEKFEAEEKKAKEQADAEEKKELAEFVEVMVKNKTKAPVIVLGFKSLKEQVVDRRKVTDKKFAARCDGFTEMASKETLEVVLKFTSLCKSVTEKKKCYHKDCRFAHSVDQLQERQCRFGLGCKFVKKIENGQYTNQTFGKTGKSCSCVHPGEHKRGLCLRLGLKFEETATPLIVTPLIVTPVATVTHVSQPKIDNAWNKVVVEVTEATTNMTRQWSAVVIETLSDDQKLEIYGKGSIMIGVVDETRNNIPIIPSIIRLPFDKRGLGFEQEKQTISTKLLVTAPGFNWVKGAVLQPSPVSDPMDKVRAAVLEINKRISNEAVLQPSPVSDPMDKVRAAVLEINKRITERDLDISNRVAIAKSKALEINASIEKREILRSERADRRSGWKKVGRRFKHIVSMETDHVTVLRVPQADAEIALLGALRNGLTNFRIEYIDKHV